MTIEIKAPTFPESVADGTIASWYKEVGETVLRDELIVDIETDKVVLEVVAPADGVITSIVKIAGDTVLSDELIGVFTAGAAGSEAPVAAAATIELAAVVGETKLSPAARKMIDDNKLDASAIAATGKGGLVTKEDVVSHMAKPVLAVAPVVSAPAPAAATIAPLPSGERIEKRVPMTRMRKRIAERLLGATQQTAMLTTFNEVNMEPVMTLRKQYKDLFEKTHDGVRLGFMGFFVKAVCEALKRFPAVNASIDGDDIVYHGYEDIGVAVSSDKGLVVPMLRDADNMSLATVEDTIRDLGMRARDGKITIDEMQGGTFTITNGGVFGSLLSTPILNPPQAAILGMHKIQERPMAVNGQVVILPMMYLALSYDHRLIDGKEAVQFLVTVKDLLEDPARILLEV
jgi:2-oxoglutarate dehydrogenase E2 component (dihydrolipoamide succinyltransferase)